jgi:ParB/RepB/Spo0J family partition protein
VGQVRPWPGNPRKTIDQAQLDELTDSVRAKGVLEPILVRPAGEGFPSGKRYYEIAAGERRWRAASAAGLEAIPALVRPLDDREMLEVAVVENELRADVPPLERAQGYQRLIEEHGVTIAELATRIGRAESTVRDLLLLTRCPELLAEALTAGQVSPATAALVCRVPAEGKRELLALHVLGGEKYWQYGTLEAESVKAYQQMGGPVLTYRQTRDLIQRSLMVELKGAIFDRGSKTLVPEAGSCQACPKRTGNDRATYPDGRADVCTDPECCRAKVQAHRARLLIRAEADGVLGTMGEDESRVFLPNGRLDEPSAWVDLESPFPNGKRGKPKTYRELVGEREPVRRQAVAAMDPLGRLRYLAPARVVEQALVDAGLLPGPQARGAFTRSCTRCGSPCNGVTADGVCAACSSLAAEGGGTITSADTTPAPKRPPNSAEINERVGWIAGEEIRRQVREVIGELSLDNRQEQGISDKVARLLAWAGLSWPELIERARVALGGAGRQTPLAGLLPGELAPLAQALAAKGVTTAGELLDRCEADFPTMTPWGSRLNCTVRHLADYTLRNQKPILRGGIEALETALTPLYEGERAAKVEVCPRRGRWRDGQLLHDDAACAAAKDADLSASVPLPVPADGTLLPED